MRILFISSCDMMAANIAAVLKREGNDVKLFIDSVDRKLNFENIVEKTDDWRKELDWVGKEGLIVFDDVGYGKEQDRLREQGFSVFGGSFLGDKLELNREHAQKIFSKYGIQTVPTYNFKSISDCLNFVKRDKNIWVLKQNGNAPKNLNYVSMLDDGRDLIDMLECMQLNGERNSQKITLQEKINGLEVGIGRYFNGYDWVGPIEINIEHKKFFPGNLGPMTSEMGTVLWYDDDDNNKLFKETISKLKPYLQKINFKGDFEINCIINEEGVFPLEATPRFGSPAIYLQEEIHDSPWGPFLKNIADGKNVEMNWTRGFGVVVVLAVPPFPYAKKIKGMSQKGGRIYFENNVFEKEKDHIHFEGVARDSRGFYISDDQGYVLYVTGIDATIEAARKKVYDIIKNIHVPKAFFRNDIGLEFDKIGKEKLKLLGY